MHKRSLSEPIPDSAVVLYIPLLVHRDHNQISVAVTNRKQDKMDQQMIMELTNEILQMCMLSFPIGLNIYFMLKPSSISYNVCT